MTDIEPQNRLQQLIAKRRNRNAVFFSIHILAVCIGILIVSNTAEAAFPYSQLVHDGDVGTVYNGTSCTGNCPLENIGTRLGGTVTGFSFRMRKVAGSNTTQEMYIRCYNDAAYTSGNDSCSWNFTGAQRASQDGSFTVSSTSDTLFTKAPNIALDPTKWYQIGIACASGCSTGNTRTMIGQVSTGDVFYEITGTNLVDPTFTLYNLSGVVSPQTPSTFRLYWEDKFYAFDNTDMKHAYFFPYNQIECFNGVGYLCDEAVYASIPPSNNGTGSGSMTWNYSYLKNGTFTAGVLVSDNELCDLQEIYTNAFCDDHIFTATVAVQIGSFESLAPTSQEITSKIFLNGGGSSGSYLSVDKKNYLVGEPVYMKWQFNLGALVPSAVRIYSGSGTELLDTLTATGDLLEGTFHTAKIFYSQAGQYQPYIRVCVGDCSTTFLDIYIGGGQTPVFTNIITVRDRTIDNGVEEGGNGSVDVDDGSGGAGTVCSNRGMFGLTATSLYVSFGSTANIFYQGIAFLINQGIDGIMWIAGNVMCGFEAAPLISNVSTLLIPDAGTVNMPTVLFGKTIDPEQLFGVDSYVIAYNSDPAMASLGTVVSTGLFAYLSIMFVLKGIFGRRKSSHH